MKNAEVNGVELDHEGRTTVTTRLRMTARVPALPG